MLAAFTAAIDMLEWRRLRETVCSLRAALAAEQDFKPALHELGQ